jgi:hypothetical protein
MGLKQRHIKQNEKQVKKALRSKMEPEQLNAISFSKLINGYRTLVNKCSLNQQDAFWGIVLSEAEEATSFLGADEAERTMKAMIDEAFKQINNQWN